jgi:Uma2 family endonuclease
MLEGMATLPHVDVTPEQYLELERKSDIKHEYYNGRMWAMSGGTVTHATISGNVTSALDVALRGTPCRYFNSDLRLAVHSSSLYTYPDAMVVCGPLQLLEPDTIANPVVIFEVLSPSTAAWDRGGKFRRYRSIPALQEYVLISQDAYVVEKYERQPDSRWLLSESSGLEAVLALNSVPCTIALRDVYRWVEFSEAAPAS